MCYLADARNTLLGLVFLTILLVALPMMAAASGDVRIEINDEPVNIPAGDQPAFIMDSRTYVPLRVISENLGATVDWVPDARQVIITSAGGKAPMPVWSGAAKEVQIIVDGEVKEFPPDYGKPFITSANRTVVPLRAVGEALGCEVNWDGAERLVEIRSVPDAPPVSALFKELAAFSSNLKLMDGRVLNSAELLAYEESDFSAAQLEQFKSVLALLKQYDRNITLPDGTVRASADLTIMGKAVASAEQLGAWAASKNPGLPRGHFVDLAELYLDIGAEYGIRGDLAFAQAAKETRYWQFTGLVKPDQNNYCGLWATGSALTGDEPLNGADPRQVVFEPGRHGATFVSPEAGVEAHIQHLYAYATKDPLPRGKVLLSPRFVYVSRGCAPTWHGLNARWAVPGPTYGQSIIQDYWLKALER